MVINDDGKNSMQVWRRIQRDGPERQAAGNVPHLSLTRRHCIARNTRIANAGFAHAFAGSNGSAAATGSEDRRRAVS
jgi:hypothetical protein